MKNTLLLIVFWLIANVCNAQNNLVEVSYDPTATNFCIYYNDKLGISSTRFFDTTGIYFKKPPEFGETDWDKTQDDIWFSLKTDYYRLWYPKHKMLFTVTKHKGVTQNLGDHLLFFIDVLRTNEKLVKN